MKKIQIFTIVEGGLGNAGPKAPLDICRILQETGKAEAFSIAGQFVTGVFQVFRADMKENTETPAFYFLCERLIRFRV